MVIRFNDENDVSGTTMLMQRLSDTPVRKRAFWLGILLPVIIAAAALWSRDSYAAPPLLVALVLGLIVKPLAEPIAPGVDFSSRRLIELGVALLGFKVTAAVLFEAGLGTLLLVLLAMLATIAASLVIAPRFRLSRTDGLLVGAATAICGSSACMAIGSLLPRSKQTDMSISVTIVGTTLLSSAAMVIYPFGATALGLSDHAAGIILGGSIHNVPQAIGAGLSFSDEAGAIATITKLIRVSMLLPVAALVLAALPLLIGRQKGVSGRKLAYIVPWFIPAFAMLLAINSTGWLPPGIANTFNGASELCLIVGLAAIGLKTSFKGLVAGGWRPLAFIVLIAFFLLTILLIGVQVI